MALPTKWTRSVGGLALALFVLVTTMLTRPMGANAHPLGNFTVNQYSRIEITGVGPRIVYVLDMAEVPTLQAMPQIDLDGDGVVSSTEADEYAGALAVEIARNLVLSLDGEQLSLRATDVTLDLPQGQAGLQTLRLRAVFVPLLPGALADADRTFAFENRYAADRLGWRELVVTHDAGVALSGLTASPADVSHELTAYPDDRLASPLDQRTVTFGARISAGAPAADGFTAFSASVDTSRMVSTTDGGRFATLLSKRELGTVGLIVTLLLAMAWGAAHALAPGHGKTVVAAYLVGSRGTPKHAAFLGLTVTVTHTAGVIALGLVTLFASRYILPETLFPWLSVFSGVLVVVMGLWTLRMRLRGQPTFGHHHHHHDHSHDHGHLHDHHHHDHEHNHDGHSHSHLPPAEISWRGLLALGVSGGLIPCPSALVVLLGSVALGRVGFGLALVVAFSLGLAATLTGLGMLFLYAGNVLQRRLPSGGRVALLLRFAPAVGSAALTLAGVIIIVRALGETSLR